MQAVILGKEKARSNLLLFLIVYRPCCTIEQGFQLTFVTNSCAVTGLSTVGPEYTYTPKKFRNPHFYCLIELPPKWKLLEAILLLCSSSDSYKKPDGINHLPGKDGICYAVRNVRGQTSPLPLPVPDTSSPCQNKPFILPAENQQEKKVLKNLIRCHHIDAPA